MIGDPLRVIDAVIAHRARREAKVVAVLAAMRWRYDAEDQALGAVLEHLKELAEAKEEASA